MCVLAIISICVHLLNGCIALRFITPLGPLGKKPLSIVSLSTSAFGSTYRYTLMPSMTSSWSKEKNADLQFVEIHSTEDSVLLRYTIRLKTVNVILTKSCVRTLIA